MKYNRLDLSKLLINIKKEFVKDILYRVLAVIIQNNILIVAWQDNNLILELITVYSV